MSINEMKSLRFARFGSPSVLRIEELPIPEPREGEALVHVKAAAINPSDIANVAGHFKNTTHSIVHFTGDSPNPRPELRAPLSRASDAKK
jgi:NADPH:quinone reductase-like Zn-dependent oxidoreductase